ncbi:hypothetical protein [Microbulbifer sp. SSSA005]|uniref:hypothetical protein n=1 Tax=Microbulbifer sp. SSSA005 TaxID=3243378 RepID=UPI00403A35F0
MMKTILFVCCFMICLGINAAEVENCTNSEISNEYFGDFSNIQFHEESNLKDVAQENLIQYAKEITKVANWDYKLSGPDEHYLPILIDYLKNPSGLGPEIECMWLLYEEGDVLRRFTDDQSHVSRSGYALFKKDELSAYFYSQIILL